MREHYHIMIMNDFLIQSNFNLIYMRTIFLNKLRSYSLLIKLFYGYKSLSFV